MKERPILFNGAMVRAVLAGTKTQTRRVLKQATGPSLSVDCSDNGVAELSWLYGDGPGHDVHEAVKFVPCPYGQPGDRLWVRETWAHHIHAACAYSDEEGPFVFAADGEIALHNRLPQKWTPAIHMFRWASRLTLEVTRVRVERLKEISEVDAIEEGITSVRSPVWDMEHFPEWRKEFDAICAKGLKPPVGPSPKVAFQALWESINGPESWAANPWVWVVEFKRVEQEGQS